MLEGLLVEHPRVGNSQIFCRPNSSILCSRASRSRYSGRIGSGEPKYSIGSLPEGLPRKYSLMQPAGETGSNVGLVTAWLTVPPITWYLRVPIWHHSMTRRPSFGSRCRVKASSAS